MNEQAIKFRSLDNWFTTAQGEQVATAFASELSLLAENVHGEKLLQFSNCGENQWLSQMRFSYKWILTPYLDKQKTSLTTSYYSLPIERESIDCIIAPLTFEAFKRNQDPLEEMDRILKSTGIVVFFGINPCSFWGAALKMGKVACFGGANTCLRSVFYLKRAMQHRGYQQLSHTSFYYIPPVSSKNHIKKLEFLNEMGKMIWPFPAGFYCLIMQKLSYPPLSPLLERLNEKTRLKEETVLGITSQSNQ